MFHINEPRLRWLCLLTEGKPLVYHDDSLRLFKNAAAFYFCPAVFEVPCDPAVTIPTDKH